MISNKIADKITKASRSLPQNSSRIVTNGTESISFDTETPKKRYITPEKRQKIIDE